MERKIDTEYWLGDKVWFLAEECIEKKCLACEGEGEIELKNGEIYECPACYGCGLNETIEALNIKKGVIRGVTLETDKDSVYLQPVYEIHHEDKNKNILFQHCRVKNLCNSRKEAEKLLKEKEK